MWVWGELVTSSQGWAPECPLHHVGVFLQCGFDVVGSCNYLCSVPVVCYLQYMYFHGDTCGVGMSIVHVHVRLVHVNVCGLVKLVPVSSWTMAASGSKQIPVVGMEDKREITVLLAAYTHK